MEFPFNIIYSICFKYIYIYREREIWIKGDYTTVYVYWQSGYCDSVIKTKYLTNLYLLPKLNSYNDILIFKRNEFWCVFESCGAQDREIVFVGSKNNGQNWIIRRLTQCQIHWEREK